MPVTHHVVQGEGVRMVVLPRYNVTTASAWKAFTHSDDLFGLDVESTAPPMFEGKSRGFFGPAVALAEYTVPSDVPSSYVKRGFTPGSKQAVKTRLIQFATKTECWVLDVNDPNWRPLIEEFLRNAAKRFVSHNANYDALRVLHEFGIRLGTRSIDTLPMCGLIWPGRTAPTDGRGKGLKEVSAWVMEDDGLVEAEKALHRRFADVYPRAEKLPKSFVRGESPCRNCKSAPSIALSIRGHCQECYDAAVGFSQAVEEWGWTNIPIDDEVFTAYAGLDAVFVRRLVDLLAAMIRERKMSGLSRREQRIKRWGVSRTHRGMKVDVPWTKDVLQEVTIENEEAGRRVVEMTGVRTPRSPQLKHWLAANGCRTKSLDKDHRPGLLIRFEQDPVVGPVLRSYDEFMTNVNLITNLQTILRHAEGGNGFVHPNINTIQAHTGRMSVTGPAMQTFSKEGEKGRRLRGCFVARPGHVLVGADYDNQETRIAAALSGDEALNRIVAENLNQHVLTAQSIFPDFVSKSESPVQYHKGKTLDFAQQYGAMPKKLAATLGISVAEATDLWLAWRETYSGLVQWTDSIASRSWIRNPFGRIIPADQYGRSYANGNYMIQSTGRDMLGVAMENLMDAGWGASIWLPVHDEIVLEVPEERAEKARVDLGECMTMHLPRDFVVDVVIPATGEIIGDRWRGLA